MRGGEIWKGRGTGEVEKQLVGKEMLISVGSVNRGGA